MSFRARGPRVDIEAALQGGFGGSVAPLELALHVAKGSDERELDAFDREAALVTPALESVRAGDWRRLVDDRCPHCAEAMAGRLLLRETECSHCERRVAIEDAIRDVTRYTRARARLSYVAVVVLGGLSGFFPPTLPIATFLGFAYVRRWLFPPYLRWLSWQRRLHAVLVLFSLFWILTAGVSIAAAFLAPLPAFAIPITAVLALFSVVLYSEAGVAYLYRQTRRDLVEVRPLRWWHWIVPGLLALAAIGVIATLVAALVLFYLVERRLT